MSVRLWFSMTTALALTIALTSLGILLISELLGGLSILTAVIIAIAMIIFQWLIAPSIISLIYDLKPARETSYAWLEDIVADVAKRSGLKKVPRVYVAFTDIANAFAFGNIFVGKKVAVTTGLLRILNPDEVKAVLGHELGHIKHRDVEIMMALSVLPAIFYLIARWAYYSGLFGGIRSGERDSSGLVLLAIAAFSVVMYYILSLFMLWVSRVREYFADLHSADVVENGSINLARALAKLELANSKIIGKIRDIGTGSLAFKALMISDPERKVSAPLYGSIDEYIYSLANKRISLRERIAEILSTHPLTPKRIRFLLSRRGS
ncbi:MAG: zinc metalloprotease HtpX [Candidatus Njordarchaeales archaeon]